MVPQQKGKMRIDFCSDDYAGLGLTVAKCNGQVFHNKQAVLISDSEIKLHAGVRPAEFIKNKGGFDTCDTHAFCTISQHFIGQLVFEYCLQELRFVAATALKQASVFITILSAVLQRTGYVLLLFHAI